MATGRSRQEIIRMFPALQPEDIQETLAYAAWWIDEQHSPCTVPEIAPQPHLIPEPLLEAKPEPISVEEPILAASETELEPIAASDEQQESVAIENTPQEESLELFHPSYPDQSTVLVTQHGLFDRRWGTHTIAWSDIRQIHRKRGSKTISIELQNPEFYFSSMPFLKRIRAQIRLIFNIHTLYLDTASLGIRTKDIYFLANRLWLSHRGKVRFRKKRRIRIQGNSSKSRSSSTWDRYQPV